MADDEYRTFQIYASEEEAQPLLELLDQFDIPYKTATDDGRLAFDVSFANNRLLRTFLVKLRLEDFEPAQPLREQADEAAIRLVDPNHYLFGFSDDELRDILAKPDEWSSFDVTLAGQLLRQRGHEVTPAALAELRQRRVAELARPEPSHPFWVVMGYAFALLGGLFGLLIGYHLYFYRKPLPDGRRVYAFTPSDRAHGLRILVLASVVLAVVLVGQTVRMIYYSPN